MRVARQHDLWVVEDCCDALGARYSKDGLDGFCGTFGHIATFSFYPAHHITMGEGGAVVTDDPTLRKLLLSIRDWARLLVPAACGQHLRAPLRMAVPAAAKGVRPQIRLLAHGLQPQDHGHASGGGARPTGPA